MMLVPNRDFDLFDDIFGDPFFRKSESKMMKTDIREDKDNYVIDIDLPGFDKKNIKIDKNNVPSATQIFTPDWIVQYMVDNSLGNYLKIDNFF